jgi:hypothetical protein
LFGMTVIATDSLLSNISGLRAADAAALTARKSGVPL